MHRLTDINIKHLLFIILCMAFLAPTMAQKQNEKFVLVLDAGHGGKDSGAPGLIESEKVIALDITLKLGKMVEDYFGDDVKVIYTRKTDVFVKLHERANIANRNNADFFVSIHCNSVNRSSPYGTETFVLGTEPNRSSANFEVVKRENAVILLEEDYEEKYEGFDPTSPESVIMFTLMQNEHLDNSLFFAKAVEDNFVNKDKRKSRGVKQAGFLVLWKTATPSVLVEAGFVSNPEEARYLASDKGKRESAESIFNAFKQYKKEWDIRHGNPVAEDAPPIAKKEEKEVKPEPKPEKPVEGKYFMVQFLTSKRKYRVTAPQLKGIKPSEIRKEGNVYKYFFGKTSFESKRDYYLAKAKRAGFPDAFVVEVKTSTKKSVQTQKPKKVAKKKKAKKEKPKTGYRIQILTSQRNYRATAPQMKGVKPVDKLEKNGLYRYFYGWYKTEEEANAELPKIKARGFADAFVVKFVNGDKK